MGKTGYRRKRLSKKRRVMKQVSTNATTTSTDTVSHRTYHVYVMETRKQEVVCILDYGVFQKLVDEWRRRGSWDRNLIVELLKHDISDKVKVVRKEFGDGYLLEFEYEKPFAVIVKTGNELWWLRSGAR